MKFYLKRFCAVALTIFLIGGTTCFVYAQAPGPLKGIKNIPSANFPTIKVAIDSLNSLGVYTGGVTFNIGLSGNNPYTETIAATLSLTATGTSAAPIVFQKNPASTSVNPIITAYTGIKTPPQAIEDGIWNLLGSDYVTIDGIDLTDPSTNTTTTAQMEYGYGLFKTSGTNGCQNVTIKNCAITLNNLNNAANTELGVIGSAGIIVMNTTASTMTTAVVPTTAAGTNSNNIFYSNTISKCNTGIALIGYLAPSPFTLADVNNDIGGSSATTGNLILNYGGGASAANLAVAISTLNQYGINVSYNTINNNNGSGTNHVAALTGILIGTATSANATITNNSITINGGGTTQNITGIENQTGSTPAGNTVNISNNTITNSTYTTATTGGFLGIYNNAATPATVTMNANTVSNNSTAATTTGLFYGFYNTGAATTFNVTNNNFTGNSTAALTTGLFTGIYNNAAVTTLNINGNTLAGSTTSTVTGLYTAIYNNAVVTAAININSNNIGSAGSPLVTFSSATANSGAQTFINNNKGGAAAALSISNNNFYNISYTTAATGTSVYIVNAAATLTQAINGNTFNNMNVNTAGGITFISNSVALTATGTQDVNGNSISGSFTKAAGGGTVTLYSGTAASASGAVINNNSNSFSNISVTGVTTIAGWSVTDAGSATRTTQNNTFTNWSGGTGAITALSVNITGTANSTTGNIINNITSGGAVIGIATAAGNDNIFSNTINTLSTTGAANVNAIAITGGTTKNVYLNKIYDLFANNVSGTVYALSVSGSTTAVTTANIYNNLIGDLRAPITSSTDAIRGISVSSTKASSNINVYYNTIYINATSSGTNFGTTGIYHAVSSVSTTAVLDLRNNIISNTSTPAGTGLIVAYRRSGVALNNYAATSNNNLFYAGSQSSIRLIFNDGTNSDQLLSAYKTRVATRDAASVSEDLVSSSKFLSVAGTSANFLHIDPTQPTQVESGGASVGSYNTDYDNQLRQDNPGYAGTGTAPDIGADEFAGITLVLSGTVNVGAGQTYTTLTNAGGLFSAINSIGLSGNLVVKIVSDITTEDGTNPLYQWAESGVGNYTVTIQPSANTARLVSGNVLAGLIRLNGADRVTIDGGNGGTTTNYLTFRNTNATNATGTAITFLNGATNNVIKYCNIEAAANATNGTILFSNTTATDGNSLNQIRFCNINSTVNSVTGLVSIYSAGTTGKENTTNSFVSNNIFNYRDRAIDVTAAGSTAWTISGNSIYNGDVSGSVNYATFTLLGIRILGGSGYSILNNYIGGNAALATGTTAAYTSSTGIFTFQGILLTTSSATPASNIKGNTVSKISVSAIPTAAGPVNIFEGIVTTGSGINIGGSTAGDGNTIGSNTANGAIVVTTTTSTATFLTNIRGIDCGSTGGAILGNQIGGIDINNVGTAPAPSTLLGIYASNATAPATINNNIIGSNGTGAAANSIRVLATSTATTTAVTGILLGTATTSAVQIDGNIIQNISFLSNTVTTLTAGGITGIANTAVAAVSITNNTISTNSIALYSTGVFYGINNSASATTVNINNNTIANNTTAATAGVYSAIVNSGTVSVALNINSNNIGTSSLPAVIFSAANSVSQTLINSTKAGVAAALSISNNNFYNVYYSLAAGGTGSNTYISVAGTPLTQAINGNNFNNLNVNTVGSITFISDGVAIPNTGTQNINNNAIITGFTKKTGGTVTLFTSTVTTTANTTTTANYSGNNFSNITVTGATVIAGAIVTDGGTGTGIITKNIQNNVFTNWSCGASGVTVLAINIASTANIISGNTINNITGASTITGITSSGGSNNIYQNVINTLTGSGAAAITPISVTGGTAPVIYKNKIYDISSNSATGSINGILISGGTTVTVYDNLIGDLRVPTGNSATDLIRGIDITSTTASSSVNIYYNTIYINATSTGAAFSTTGIYHTTSTTATTAALSLINNSITNTSTATGTGKTVAYRRSTTTLTNYASTSDNNLYYAGTASTANLIFYDGTNSDQTLATYQARVAARDAASVSENLTSKFLSTTGSSSVYLHMNSTIASAVQNAGKFISITDDYDGQTRAASPGPPNPDIGADEVTGLENTPPVISYTVLANTTSTSNVILANVTITDGSGVNVASGTKPRIYYKRFSDANTVVDNTSNTNGWKYTEATNSATPFSFTIDYSLLNGGSAVVAGPIQYFITAQDLATIANVGINSGVFNSAPASVALTSSAFPITGTINVYNIPFSGSYNVGTSQVFTSLTKSDGIFAGINSAGFSGNVTINVTSNTTEDGTAALNQWVESGAGNYTLTIQPDATSLRTLSGNASTGLVRLNGADRVTIDGGVSSSLVFKNTNTNGTGIAFTFINAATNNTLHNIEADAFANAGNGVILFSTSTGVTGNNNNVIDNTTINGTVSGNTSSVDIYSAGTAGKENTGITISNCDLQNFSNRAIDIASASTNWTISTNDIYNGSVTGSINYPASSVLNGIRIATGSGYTILNNNIGGAVANTGGANAVYSSNLGDLFYSGISLTTTGATPASTIKGNKISAISVSSVPGVASSPLFTGIETFGSGITVGGTTAAEGNIIGSKTANSAIFLSTSTTNTANTSSVIGINYSSSGGMVNFNNVGGFDISNLGTSPAGSVVQGIAINNVTAPTQVNSNIIGSASIANSIRVVGASTAPATTITGINIGSAVNSAMQINTNRIDNISNLSTTSSGIFTGINNASSNSGAVFVMQSDTIQNISTAANSNAASGIFTGISSGSPSTISSNLIKSISLLSTGINAQIQGINVFGGYAQTVSGNTITTLTTASAKANTSSETGSPALSAISGILNSATVDGQVISGNSLTSFNATNTAAINPTITGIGVIAPLSGNLFNNRISTLVNSATGTDPGDIGIMAAAGTFNAYNNVVRMGNGSNTNGVKIYGIIHAAGANWNYFYNSVQIQGTSNGTVRTAAFLRPVSGTLTLKNNNFVNIRSGSGTNYAISNPVSPPTDTWPSSTSDYNNLYSTNHATTGEWGAGTAQTFGQWQTSSAGDSHSVSSSVTIVNVSNELRPDSTTNCALNNAGTSITTPISITKDVNNITRSSSTPDIGAYEFTYITFAITASSNSPICSGSTVSLSVDPGTATNPTYVWKDPSGNVISTLQNPTVAAVAGTYTVTVFDLNGCSVTANVPVVINARPTARMTSSITQTCEGTSVNLSLAVTGTGTLNGTLSDGTTFSGTAPTITVPVNPSVTTSFYIASLSDAACTSIRADIPDTVKITVTHAGNWLGLVSTDWNNAANWCGGVPTSLIDVDIKSGVPYYPVLTAGSYTCADFVIEPGASVTVNGGTLKIAGDISNSGTFSAGGGTVELNGTTAQIIPAATFAGNSVNNLRTNNSAGITLGGPLNVIGILTPAVGAFNANGNVTLVSSATQTALIDGSGAGTVTGNVTMQRYLAAGYGYKYFSSPVQAATVGSFSGLVDLSATFSNFYTYIESNTSSGFTAYTNTSNVLTPLKGYAVDFGAASDPKTVNITGVVNNGAISSTISNTNKTYTLGFNLVGNPYPSPVDWDAATGWTKTNIDNAIYYFDSGTTSQYTGTYSTYINGVSSDGVANNILASMQGFFVHVSNGAYPVTGTLGVTNAARVNNLSPVFHKSTGFTNAITPRILIRLSAGFSGDRKSSDPVVVYSNSTASQAFNNKLDAIKLLNTNELVPNLYISGADEVNKLVIKALQSIDSTTTVPLSLHISKSGLIDFNLLAADNLPYNLSAYLYDAKTNKSTRLSVGSRVSIDLDGGDYDGRFYLKFGPSNGDNTGQDTYYLYRKDGKIYVNIKLDKEQSGTLSLINITGNVLTRQKVNGNGIYDVGSPKVFGIYVVSFVTANGIHAKKIFVPE